MDSETKFYRLADGRLGKVRIVVDDDQSVQNPRKNESTGSFLVTYDRDYISPDAELPAELDEAERRWADSNGVAALLFLRYAHLFHADSILYIGALCRNGYNGVISIDDSPTNGQRCVGIVVITRESWKALNGDDEPTPDAASELARFEVTRYSAWAAGEVYGYVAEIGNEKVDSCWGYIGVDEFDFMHQCGRDALGSEVEEISEAEYETTD